MKTHMKKLSIPTTDADYVELAARLSRIPIHGTEHMSEQERKASVSVVLADLHRLADKNGCIAAAWALGAVNALAGTNCRVESDHAIMVRHLRLGSGVGHSLN